MSEYAPFLRTPIPQWPPQIGLADMTIIDVVEAVVDILHRAEAALPHSEHASVRAYLYPLVFSTEAGGPRGAPETSLLGIAYTVANLRALRHDARQFGGQGVGEKYSCVNRREGARARTRSRTKARPGPRGGGGGGGGASRLLR